ncbi:hypothetical protein [uncultured Roseobacter sp.]|uniref:hypothetical protein n=1 Tax=uncultured Roseobacter sp. TaxID=114847 RepID=UPI00260747BF|nr:hypothetical protein [uncultured Roseobacter sp.]
MTPVKTSLAISCALIMAVATSAMAQRYVGSEGPSKEVVLKNLKQISRCIKKNTNVIDVIGIHGSEARKTVVVRYGRKPSDNYWDNGKVSLVRFDNSNEWMLSCSWGDGLNGFGTEMRIITR